MKLFTKITIIIFIGILLVTVIVTSNEDNGGPLGRKTVAEMDQRVKAYGVENVCAFVNTKTHTIGYYDVIDPICHEEFKNTTIQTGLYDLYLTKDNVFIILDPQKDDECLATWPNQFPYLQDYFSKDNPAPVLVYQY